MPFIMLHGVPDQCTAFQTHNHSFSSVFHRFDNHSLHRWSQKMLHSCPYHLLRCLTPSLNRATSHLGVDPHHGTSSSGTRKTAACASRVVVPNAKPCVQSNVIFG